MMKTESDVVSYYEDLINRLKTTEEGKRRLANMGLTPEDINDFFVTFKKGEGNYVTTGIDYNTGNPFINIDFSQTDLLNQGLLPRAKGKNYGITYGITAAHEAAHALDMIKAFKNYKNAKNISDNLWETKYKSKFYGPNKSKYEDEYFDFLNDDWFKRTPDQYTYDQYVNDYLRYTTPAIEPNKVSYFYKPNINNLNREVKGVYGDPSVTDKITPDFNPTKLSSFEQKALDDAKYFTHGIEPYAHVREFRRGMMEKGILKNEWDPVTKTMIDRYMKSDANDRIKGFMKNTPDFKKRMKRWLNKYPAVIPAAIGTGAAGYGIMQQPKQQYKTGGTLKYQGGGKVIVDGKEISIDSNEYRRMYESGNLMNVDKDGIPIRWSDEEVVVTAQMTDEERQKRKNAEMWKSGGYNIPSAQIQNSELSSISRTIPSAYNIEHLKGNAVNRLSDIYSSPGYKRKLENEILESKKLRSQSPYTSNYGEGLGKKLLYTDNDFRSAEEIIDERIRRVKNTPMYNMGIDDESYNDAAGVMSANLQSLYLPNTYYVNPKIKVRTNLYGNTPEDYRSTLVEELEHASHFPYGYFKNPDKYSVLNITPYAKKIFDENTPANRNPYGDRKYLKMYSENMAKKRATENYLIDQGILKPGENVDESHYKYLIDNFSDLPDNVQDVINMTSESKTLFNNSSNDINDIMIKLYQNDNSERSKKELKEALKKKENYNKSIKNFINIMNKIAYNDEQSNDIETAKYGGTLKYQLGGNTPTQEDRERMDKDIKNRLAGKDDFYGISMTKLNPNEEYTYQQWVKGLTPNLRGSAEDKNYDMRGAWKVGEQPELFYYDNNEFTSAHPIDVKQQGSIYEPHLFSRNPFTGKSLKGPNHPSFMHALEGDIKSNGKVKMDIKTGDMYTYKKGGNFGGLNRWFAEKWVDVKTGKPCGRQEGESRRSYPACRPSVRINSKTPKTSSELSSAEKERFKRSKTSSQRINYQHKRNK